MATLETFLPLAHILGLALALGSATSKLTLLLKARADHTFVPAYIAIARPITRLILAGTGLLVMSGVIWLLIGYPLSGLLVVKLVLVGMIIVLGASLDKFVEPRFQELAPAAGQSASPAFIQIQRLYVLLEVTATVLYYAVVVLWVLR